VRGYGREGAASARKIAASLIRAADEVETFVAAEARRKKALDATNAEIG
jgi:hypothetical protein